MPRFTPLCLIAGDTGPGRLFFPTDRVKCLVGYREQKRRLCDTGELTADKTGFRFSGRREERCFPYSEMSGCAVVTANRLEFYHGGVLYEMQFADRRGNGVKYLRAMQIVNPAGAELN